MSKTLDLKLVLKLDFYLTSSLETVAIKDFSKLILPTPNLTPDSIYHVYQTQSKFSFYIPLHYWRDYFHPTQLRKQVSFHYSGTFSAH